MVEFLVPSVNTLDVVRLDVSVKKKIYHGRNTKARKLLRNVNLTKWKPPVVSACTQTVNSTYIKPGTLAGSCLLYDVY